MAAETTVKKVDSEHSPHGRKGERILVTGKNVAMRKWDREAPTSDKPSARHDYETVGYVIEGRAKLRIEDQTIMLEPGDSWLVPAGATHTYEILEPFTAIEATSPPAHLSHLRD